MILKLAKLGAFALLAECFCLHPGSTGTGWLLFPSRFIQALDTCFEMFKRLDIPKSTAEFGSSVPQNQLFYCPFLLGKTWKIHLVVCCIKTAKKAKITFKRPTPFTRPQGQLFCIIPSNSFCFSSFYHLDCHIRTHNTYSHPPLIWRVQEGYCA